MEEDAVEAKIKQSDWKKMHFLKIYIHKQLYKELHTIQ